LRFVVIRKLSVEKTKTTHNKEHEQLTTDNQQQTINTGNAGHTINSTNTTNPINLYPVELHEVEAEHRRVTGATNNQKPTTNTRSVLCLKNGC
jgi:hypothetical protein